MKESLLLASIDNTQLVDLREHRLWAAVLAGWHCRQWPGKGSFESRLQAFRKHLDSAPVPATLVLVKAGQPIGSVSLIRYASSSAANTRGSYWVANVYVAEEYRGCGHGRRLIVAIENRARQLRIRRLYLYSSDKWRFYRHLGWQVCAEKLIDGEQSRVMFRTLLAPRQDECIRS